MVLAVIFLLAVIAEPFVGDLKMQTILIPVPVSFLRGEYECVERSS